MNKEVFFNLPKKVVFCKACVMSNQRPSSVQEFKHVKERKGAIYLNINEEGVCDACLQNEIKNNQINWEDREEELLKILEKHRKNDGSYDCLVPGSGGKDSVYQAHILKYKYGMHPLLTTWSPILYTDYGYENYKNWIEIGGFDNVTFKPNGKAMKTLTRLSIENLLHPFQTFILGQKNLAPKIASQYGIDLVFYGENEAEYGNPLADNAKSLRDKSYFTYKNINDIFLGGLPIKQILEEHDLSLADLTTFLPLAADEFDKTNIQIHYLGYYLRWIPQEAYYYAVEHTNFQARPYRSQGTYSKYNSIDDKIDDLHYYTTFIKYGLGRATYDASQEIRNNHLTRKEAQALVKKFDGEFPDRYFNEIMDYLSIEPERFHEICNEYRSPHLWKKANKEWSLRHTVNFDGTDDKVKS
jgi:N-acetyl sugar amidotransferase